MLTVLLHTAYYTWAELVAWFIIVEPCLNLAKRSGS
jgi:hypothetical protein